MESQNNPRRSSALLSVLFIVIVLAIALLRSSQIIFVFALYVCLLFAGVSLAVFIMYSTPTWETDSSLEFFDHNRPTPKGSDVVSSLNVYVKFASRGSGHSRREIAYVIRNILANRNASRKLDDSQLSRQLAEDLDKVVYPYTSDSLRNSKIAKVENLGFKAKTSREEKEAYLTSLERIVRILRNQGVLNHET